MLIVLEAIEAQVFKRYNFIDNYTAVHLKYFPKTNKMVDRQNLNAKPELV